MANSGLVQDSLNKEKSPHTRILGRKRSFRDVQSLISQINPEVVRSVIANGCEDSKKPPVCIPPTTETQWNGHSVPVSDPTLRLSNRCRGNPETAPMTIFYNGKVTVFDVSPLKAQDILKHAEEAGGLPRSAEKSVPNQTAQYFLHYLTGDLPVARRKSLQSFLERRKQRLTVESPYL